MEFIGLRVCGHRGFGVQGLGYRSGGVRLMRAVLPRPGLLLG